MISIKIQCGCGQRYAFDVEPAGNCMPYSVACPACGTDGTSAANAAIAQSMPAQPASAAEPRPHTAATVPAARPVANSNPTSSTTSFQLERPKAEMEARSKIMWGDPPEDVTKFLMMQGISYEEATVLVEAMVQERMSMLRGIGFRKILIAVPMMCVPVVAFIYFSGTGFFPLKTLGAAVGVGLWGAYIFLKGSLILLAPRSEPGDIADK